MEMIAAERISSPFKDVNVPTEKDVKDVNVLTERVKKRRTRVTAVPHIDAERTRLVAASWKETEGEPLVIRRAKLFRKIMEEIPVVIREGELVVGSASKYERSASGGVEFAPSAIMEILNEQELRLTNEVEGGDITEEERETILESAKYFVGKSAAEAMCREQRRVLGDQVDIMIQIGMWQPMGDVPVLNQLGDYGRVVNQGLISIIAKAKEERKKLTSHENPQADLRKSHFLEAIIMCLEALITYAGRHAELARNLTEKEADVVRKRELERIAEICEWVPANPARNFHEAVQSFWFTFMAVHLEQGLTLGSPGRMDQYLYPAYHKDLREGRITVQEAAELLGCLWVKLNENEALHGVARRQFGMASTFQQVTISGTTAEGKDATNELSFLILEVARQMRMPQPAIYIRFHDHLSEEFLIKALETNRDLGGGIPAFLSDELGVRNLLKRGVSPADAREWATVGCAHPGVQHCYAEPWNGGEINAAKILELTLNNGVDSVTGNHVAGMSTGEPTSFATFDELYAALKRNMEWVIDLNVKQFNVGIEARNQHYCHPFLSALLDDCMERGLDYSQGGLRYPYLGDRVGMKGMVNVANSLAAMKKLVYEEQKISMAELVKALRANWEGCEHLRQMCVNAPKFGNDDDYVDDIMSDLCLFIARSVVQRVNPWGEPVRCCWEAGSGYYYMGLRTGATPDGRKAREVVVDATLSPMSGTDRKGPTAVFNSATKVDYLEDADSTMLNMKFAPSLLRNKEGMKKFLALLKTYFDSGGYHVQVNMLSKETLLDAKLHPENYRNLLVRVAGYSAFWVELSPDVQDQIIARAEQPL